MLSAAIRAKKRALLSPSHSSPAEHHAARRTRRLAMNCWHCSTRIEIVTGGRIGFRDECPKCGRALHSCRNCGFYDPSYNNSCRETMAERVVDKERFNFCEYFIPSDAAAKPAAKKNGAQDKLEALFKKKS
jgi:hypothetical protein